MFQMEKKNVFKCLRMFNDFFLIYFHESFKKILIKGIKNKLIIYIL